MVTVTAVATMATTVAVVVAKTMAATEMAGGTDNNQLKAAVEEMIAVAMETGMAALIIVWRHAKSSGEMISMVIASV